MLSIKYVHYNNKNNNKYCHYYYYFYYYYYYYYYITNFIYIDVNKALLDSSLFSIYFSTILHSHDRAQSYVPKAPAKVTYLHVNYIVWTKKHSLSFVLETFQLHKSKWLVIFRFMMWARKSMHKKIRTGCEYDLA